jgi:hypothetical protein
MHVLSQKSTKILFGSKKVKEGTRTEEGDGNYVTAQPKS